MEQAEKVKLFDKIDHALTEVRMILPGAQAMLGFQFVAMLTDPFDGLPAGSKAVHVVSLVLVAVAITCLMTPAAFHRIVERGEATPRQYKVTVGFMLAAMIVLAPGVTGDLYVVLRKVTGSAALAAGVAGGMLALYYGLWFGLSLVLRLKRGRSPESVGRMPNGGQQTKGDSRPNPVAQAWRSLAHYAGSRGCRSIMARNCSNASSSFQRLAAASVSVSSDCGAVTPWSAAI